MPTVLITGGHSGIGLDCSKDLAARGFDLVLAGRSPARMQIVAQELRSAHNVDVLLVELDTSSLASVRTAADECQSLLQRGEIGSLVAVICNAGGRFDGDVRYSEDGYELTFATNCLGHFLLVQLTVPLLAARGRVVFTASGTHDPDTMDGRMVGAAMKPDAFALANDGKDGSRPLSAGKRYSTSKLCDVMYAYELARRLERAGSSVSAISFDPGSIPSTGFLRDMPKAMQWLANTRLFGWVSRRMGVVTSTSKFSGTSLAQIATEDQYPTGSYLQANAGTLTKVRSSTVSYDEQIAVTLWNDSKDLVGLIPDEEPAELR
ncbi:SDR family NAD(P)-dependent oxidoreductase [Rhodococcus sp. P1Y]|uniref:SDR family NAD(P)-dependent oxidoreductase n=1 Tax=Rhodococcus sp. P1Y TaxID=1302308 RepID=UPI000EB3AD9A|nr:SDR family NAD(P)-dependent oxidoreductase [Rhodococcus sp. P1Y]AYJ48816.1 SDR family NAD(P)-dependent oxidoreductase [Rhodococcus sp. P1Y]